MSNSIFTDDIVTTKEPILIQANRISESAKIISAQATPEQLFKGEMFAQEIFNSYITDFEKNKRLFRLGKAEKEDLMVHVSTFLYLDDTIYMTYYANTETDEEYPPNHLMARFVYCPIDDVENKTFINVQSVGDDCYGGAVELVYDTVLMQKDDHTLYILWTASISGKYYRLYRTFDTKTKTLSDVFVNKFKVGETVNDFSMTGITSALTENGIGYKNMYSDIGIMQKLSWRMENGEKYYYTGAYSGDFNCIIKSKDLVTWEYVAQPDFLNFSQYENAVYVLNDKCYYFVRQYDDNKYGFLTYYDLKENKWEKPVLIADCQSRSDFIMYDGELFLFFAPVDREHIGIARIDTNNLADTEVVLQANMHSSCFYPFIQYGNDGELRMSYTINRKHIRLAKFTMKKYIV